MSNGNPIIIKGGGSIEILFSEATFPPDSKYSDRHYNAEYRITSVQITDNSTGKPIPVPIPADGKVTITIEYGL